MIRFTFLFLFLTCCLPIWAQKQADSDLRSLLISQIQNAFSHQEWFIPLQKSVANLDYLKASTATSEEDHSIAQLLAHISYWNKMNADAFINKKTDIATLENNITFKVLSEEEWLAVVTSLPLAEQQWINGINNASEEELQQWSEEIANMCAHMAYHTGQIIHIRKSHGWWK